MNIVQITTESVAHTIRNSANVPDDELEEDTPFQSQVDAQNEGEGEAQFSEYEMRFAASLEPKDDKYARKVKEYKVKLKELLEKKHTVTKKPSEKAMGVGSYVVERRNGGRKGIILSGSDKVWEVEFEDGTVETDIASQRLKKDEERNGLAYVWSLVEESIPDPGKEVREYNNIGLAGFDFGKYFSEEAIRSKKNGYDFPFLKLMIKLWPGDWRKQLERLNLYIEHEYNKPRDSKRRIALISQNEW